MLVEFVLGENKDLRLFLAAEAVVLVEDLAGKPGKCRVVYDGVRKAGVQRTTAEVAVKVIAYNRGNATRLRPLRPPCLASSSLERA